MPISSADVGRRYPATAPHEVTQAELDGLARALGLEPGPAAPPTYAMVIAAPAWEQLFGDASLGLALERTMHAEQGFTYHRPIHAGDRLSAELEVTKVRSRGGSDFVSIRVDIRDADGRLTVEAPSTFVCRQEAAA